MSLLEDEEDADRVGDDQVSWDQTDLIRQNIRAYLNHFLTILAKLKRCVDLFEKMFSPENCLRLDEVLISKATTMPTDEV